MSLFFYLFYFIVNQGIFRHAAVIILHIKIENEPYSIRFYFKFVVDQSMTYKCLDSSEF